MNAHDAAMTKIFLEDDDTMKIDNEPYNGSHHSLRIRCYDSILIIHDAEVFDFQDYTKYANDIRIEMQNRRIHHRKRRLEALGRRVEKELLTLPRYNNE